MRKRIRIRKAILVTAFAAVIGGAMVTPATAYEVTNESAPKSHSCNVNPQALRADPQMCSQQIFSDLAKDSDPVRSANERSSSPIPMWTIYPIVGALVLLGASKLIRNHHNKPGLAA